MSMCVQETLLLLDDVVVLTYHLVADLQVCQVQVLG